MTKIEKLRKAAGLTKIELANRVEVRYKVIDLVEKGHEPKIGLLKKLSKFFGCSIALLLEESYPVDVIFDKGDGALPC
ncbi:MAG: helix-turn-helix domain-containing protein [Firmicutes bacterium]|nr:helix-turn-helix domain-containing protein [Bacillota bacterium]